MRIEETNHVTTFAEERFHRYGKPDNKSVSDPNKHLSKLDDLINLKKPPRLINNRKTNTAPFTSAGGSQERKALNIIIPTSRDKDYIKFMDKLSRKLGAELVSTDTYQASIFSNLYNQIHEIATKHPEANIKLLLMHNRFIKPIWSYLDQHSEMIPRGTTLDVWYYSGYELKSCESLSGRGPIDRRHRETMEHMSKAEKINNNGSALENKMAPAVTPENLIPYLSVDLADALKSLRDNPSPENKNNLVAIAKDLLTKITEYLPKYLSTSEVTYLADCLTDRLTDDDLTTIRTIIKEPKIWSDDIILADMRFIASAIITALFEQKDNELKKNPPAKTNEENLAALEKLKNSLLARTQKLCSLDEITQYDKDIEEYLKNWEYSKNYPHAFPENKSFTTIANIAITIIEFIAKLIAKLATGVRVINNSSFFSSKPKNTESFEKFKENQKTGISENHQEIFNDPSSRFVIKTLV